MDGAGPIASHESYVQIYGVVSTAPPEFPPPKLKKARVGATVLVVRRLVETVGRVVTLVPVANADIVVIAIMMDGTARSVRPSVRPSLRRSDRKNHFEKPKTKNQKPKTKNQKPKTTPSDERRGNNGKGSPRTSRKVGRQRVGGEKKQLFCIYRIDGSRLN